MKESKLDEKSTLLRISFVDLTTSSTALEVLHQQQTDIHVHVQPMLWRNGPHGQRNYVLITLVRTEKAMLGPSRTAISAAELYMCRNCSGQRLGLKRGASSSDLPRWLIRASKMLVVCIGSLWTNSYSEQVQAYKMYNVCYNILL